MGSTIHEMLQIRVANCKKKWPQKVWEHNKSNFQNDKYKKGSLRKMQGKCITALKKNTKWLIIYEQSVDSIYPSVVYVFNVMTWNPRLERPSSERKLQLLHVINPVINLWKKARRWALLYWSHCHLLQKQGTTPCMFHSPSLEALKLRP